MSTTKTISLLPEPAIYFPISDDRYSTRAGLTKFGYDFGNQQHDQHLFQFDKQFTHYRQNKLSIRKNSLQDYMCADTVDLTTISSAAQFILQHLCHEHPNYFSLEKSSQGSVLNCLLTDEQLHIDDNGHLLKKNQSQYKNLFDALALQLQEDICVMQIKDPNATMIAAHLCAPNHWSARDKLNMDMSMLHQHVPNFHEENRQPNQLITGLYNKTQAYVRFAWGLNNQANLNQHPNHQQFNTVQADNNLWMRIERQVIWPIPHTNLLLFSIRTYFRDVATLKEKQLISLKNAVNSMSDDILKYKNINKEDVIRKLKNKINRP